MVRSTLRSLLLLSTCLGLTACAGTERLIKSAALKPQKNTERKTEIALAPMIQYGGSAGYGSGGVHTVLSGDNLHKIATQYKLNTRDIIDANGLVPPYRLSTGMRLQLPPPQTYRVKQGDNVPLIAKTFSVSQRDLIALNNISAPYRLVAGQKINLPRARAILSAPPKTVIAAAPVTPVFVPPPVQQQHDQGAVITREALPPVVAQTPTSAGKMSPPPAPSSDIQSASLPANAAAVDILPPISSSGFLKPVNGTVISRYGPKSGGLYNEGINIAAPRGSPVRAANAGRVVYVGNAVEGYGNLVLIKHDSGYITAYAHMDKTFAKEGQVVKRGATIGTVGSTGNVDRAQLHFEVRKGRQSIDPTTVI